MTWYVEAELSVDADMFTRPHGVLDKARERQLTLAQIISKKASKSKYLS